MKHFVKKPLNENMMMGYGKERKMAKRTRPMKNFGRRKFCPTCGQELPKKGASK